MLFHVLNLGVGRMRLFLKGAEFEAFEKILERTLETRPMRILAYTLMSNHWHMVLWPEHDGDLGAFMQKLTITHARNWQLCRRRVGYGHLYQGRYNSFPIEGDEHFYQVVPMSSGTHSRPTLFNAPRPDDIRACGGGCTAIPPRASC